MSTDTNSEQKPKLTEATTVLVSALEPFASPERIRIVTAALALLGESSLTSQSAPNDSQSKREFSSESQKMSSEFFTKFDHEKPSDNALLVAAYLYAKYGAAPFSVDEVRQIAEREAGLTVPSRLDMTFDSAARAGKNLFARAGRGQFKVTVQGEKFLRETYSVRKGNEQKSA